MTPHPPQLLGSLRVLAHCPLHVASPLAHTQVPPKHVAVPPHAFPQAPQLSGSRSRLAQTPLPQSVVAPPNPPPPQSAAHCRLLQTSPLGQALPQAPQLFGSLRTSTHAPLQT